MQYLMWKNIYRLCRNDRNAAGGGVMVYARSDIPSRRLSQTEPENASASG